MTTTTIVLLNGPARSGKDTLGNALVKTLEPDQGEYGRARVMTFKFANLLKRMTHGLFDMGHILPSGLEDRKDKPMEELFGITPRQAYIAVSEKLIKPVYGVEFFGKRLADVITTADVRYAIITDSGFAAEAKALMAAMRPGTQVILVKMSRDGFTFEGDSRSYIRLPGVKTVEVNLGKDCVAIDTAVRTVIRGIQDLRGG